MNVLQRLNAVLDRKSTGVAKITGHLGGNAWAAESQTGGNLILTGEAEMGGRVFTISTPTASQAARPIWPLPTCRWFDAVRPARKGRLKTYNKKYLI